MTTQSSLRNIRPLEILAVDDDYTWRYLIASNLEADLGTIPVLASTGTEALEIMAERPIDVVICDLLMPGIDGLQFLNRAQNLFRRTKIILLSAEFDAFPIPAERLIAQGAFAAIRKTEISSTLIPILQLLQGSPDMVVQTPEPGTWRAGG